MSVYDMVSISLMSAPAAKTFSPPQTMTADDVAALGGLAARGDQAVLDLAVERVHRGPVEADRADAVLDLEADEVAHEAPPAGASPSAVGSSPSTRWCQMCTPDRITWIDTWSMVLTVGAGRREVLADDDEGRAGHAGLDAVHVEVELVARLVQVQPVGEEVVLDLPLAEDPHDLDLALGAPHEELLVVDGERDVAVVVEVRLQAEVDEHVEDPAAQRVLVRRRGEVGQRRGIGHGSNLTTH